MSVGVWVVPIEQRHDRCALHEGLNPIDHPEQQTFAPGRAVTKDVARPPALVRVAAKPGQQPFWPGEDLVDIVAEMTPGPKGIAAIDGPTERPSYRPTKNG